MPGRIFEFSIRSEIRRGQNQIRILRRAPTSSHAKPTHQSLTLFCMNSVIVFCIDKQMGQYELISACFFLEN